MAKSKKADSAEGPDKTAQAPASGEAPHTLAIDVGGSHIKASVLDRAGGFMTDRVRVVTPVGNPPDEFVEAIRHLVEPLPSFDRVSVGFPGVVRDGVVRTAPNLGNDRWKGFDLAGALSTHLGKPVRVLNDADMQGLGVIQGHGLEMVVTLGTGFGTGVYMNGQLLPHLEIAHQAFRKGETFDEQLGNAARKRVGDKKWSKRVKKAIADLRSLTNFDHLYLGGGNAKRITFEPDSDVTVIGNEAGIEGGVAAWHD
ncbi:MAG TPA: ROK family protein [Candidatus Methylomirabilis sp.]|nr:ROK family protein [Candidatus Methylomirabilis sp.]